MSASKITERHRQPATITGVKDVHVEQSHNCITSDIFTDEQSFGGIAFDSVGQGENFSRTVCQVFGVERFSDLIGKRCYLLRNFGLHGETIEGLESVDTGRRFTLNGWRCKMFPGSPNAFERACERAQSTIVQLQRRINEEERLLERMKEIYVDWETEK